MIRRVSRDLWARAAWAACLVASAHALRSKQVALAHSQAARQGNCTSEAVCIEFHDRLGNNLYQFERAMWVAKQLNFCFLAVPTPVGKNALSAMIATPQDGILHLQRSAPNLTRAQVYERCSVNCLECAPPQRAAAMHLRVCSEWGPCDLGRHSLPQPTTRMLRQTVQEHVLPLGYQRCDPSATRLPQDAVLMHMRSGDTLNARSGFYPQPPCAYYAAVMRRGNGGRAFATAVIVTEPDLQHPCIDHLRKAFPGRVTVQSRSVTEDACTMASAPNVAISFGTWGPALSRLNRHLTNLYVPFGEDGVTPDEYGGSLARMAKHWFHQAFDEDGMPYSQHLYSFPGFRCAWRSRLDHFASMVQYSEARIVVRSLPGSNSSASGT
mmetsp:Transcript_46654/g.107804  ORF Transcript_46654/g.107804 Transcript_46654/m.107804 type:complete len:381 (-) Transcript_46654:73-1215(-)